jgi:hypothetical protein
MINNLGYYASWILLVVFSYLMVLGIVCINEYGRKYGLDYSIANHISGWSIFRDYSHCDIIFFIIS